MSRIKVLVIDDAAFMRDLIKNGIRAHFPHFALDEAINGKQAQGRLLQEHYDLVLCDWEMPEMKGDELLMWMRQEPKTRDIPFVMVTSRGDREHVVRAIELGVSNYLTKPFTSERLVSVVAKVLSKHTNLTPKDLRIKVEGPPKMGNNSPEVLAARRDIGLSGAVPIAERIGPASGAERIVHPSRKTLGQFRFAGSVVRCLLKEISRQEVTGVFRREDTLPQILDAAVFDFPSGEESCSINGYIHALRAAEDSRQSDFLNMTVRFVDEDEQKQAHLERFVASLG